MTHPPYTRASPWTALARAASCAFLVLAVSSSNASAAPAYEAPPAGLRLRLLRGTVTVDATCVLIRQHSRENGDSVLYFVTGGTVFKSAYGQPLPYADSITVTIGDTAVAIRAQDVILPFGNLFDVAILKVMTREVVIAPPVLTLDVPDAGSFFVLAGIAPDGLPAQVTEKTHRRATLVVTGDRSVSLIDGCIGAPAIGEHGVFGIANVCERDRPPRILPFAAIERWIARNVPGGFALPHRPAAWPTTE